MTLAFVLVAVGIFVFFRFRDDADHAIDAELRVRADAFFGEPDPDQQLRVALLGLSDEHFGQVLDADGRVAAERTAHATPDGGGASGRVSHRDGDNAR